MQFTFEDYSELIKLIKKQGYTISNYIDYENYEKVVIIKHDVDMSLNRALKMAEFENQLGIKSVYNILLCSDFYNPYSKKNMQCIKRIEELGHEIYFHFDEVRYSGNISANIDKEIDILEKLIEGSVDSVSMHRPSEQTLQADLVIHGGKIVNSYSKQFFKEFKYISDSRRSWREDPKMVITCGQYDKIHILTHPIWYTEKEEDIAMRLRSFVDEAAEERYETLKENIRDLDSVFNL